MSRHYAATEQKEPRNAIMLASSQVTTMSEAVATGENDA